MKIYEELVEELVKPYRVSNGIGHKVAKLNKFKEQTEDELVQTSIDSIILHLKDSSKLRTLKRYKASNKEAEIATNLMCKLAAYCQIQIETNKPEWMILAERHGWTPPYNNLTI